MWITKITTNNITLHSSIPALGLMPTVLLFSNHFPIKIRNSLFWNLKGRYIPISLSPSLSSHCFQRSQRKDRKSLFTLAKTFKKRYCLGVDINQIFSVQIFWRTTVSNKRILHEVMNFQLQIRILMFKYF